VWRNSNATQTMSCGGSLTTIVKELSRLEQLEMARWRPS
jgi:hypothetical protein